MHTRTPLLLAVLGSLGVFVLLLRQPGEGRTNAPSADVSQHQERAHDAPDKLRVTKMLARMPLHFIENRGQLDPQVAYYIQGSENTIYFTREGITLALTGKSRSGGHALAGFETVGSPIIGEPAEAPERWAVKLDFVGANPEVNLMGAEKTRAVISYFKGPREEWNTGLSTYGSIIYSDLWPGVDLVYTGTVNRLKYSFLIHPGADPGQIRLAYRGTTSVHVNEAGRLEVETPIGGFEDDAPRAHQEAAGNRREIAAEYVLGSAAAPGEHTYQFRLGPYDRTKTLILDPSVLVYAGFIGGSSTDNGFGVAVDSLGDAYVTGFASSSETTFPDTVGPDLTFNGNSDAFVAKVGASGATLLYAGYIGGSDVDEGRGVAVDAAGNAYIAGFTRSNQSTFPATVGPDVIHNGAMDGFVAKVNSAGTALDYAGYIGGSANDAAHGVAVDGVGSAYVTGSADSTEATFPVVVGPDVTSNGGSDAFVAKVNSSGVAFDYAGYIGGSGSDFGRGIAVDVLGNAYATGQTTSTEASFPVLVGPDLTHNGAFDAYVVKVNSGGAALDYAGYIGGSAGDAGHAIATDSLGSAYATGRTESSEASFPVAVGPDLSHNGMRDAFVAKVSSAGTGLVYAGYIGGAAQDEGLGVALDSSGSAYVTGYTTSSESSFPVTGGPDLTFNGVIDAFAAKINIAGSALDYAGYIGGNNSDEGFGIAVDALGNSYVAGRTSSSEATFPTVIGPDVTFNGGEDAFIVKISELVPATPTPTPTSTATATQPPTDTPTPTPTPAPAPVNVPGKVTGGGSILADGSLAPATLSIESGINASIGDTATFGFAVQFEAGDPNPTGNLTYNDHGADVRIKALSFSLLSIGVGPCGMDTHAKFRGTAEVTGPGMPSMQDFEVDVDDCGEPGSAPGVGPDTFMIRTSVGTTIHYLAAGPLVGGNIQVQRD